MILATTQRLIIRSFMLEDAEPLRQYLSAPSSPCFLQEILHSAAEATAEVARRSLDHSQLAVALKDNNRLIGHLFADNQGEPDENTWSVGWHFNPDYQGQGFATESITALYQYLFTVKQARRLYAYVEDYNQASQRLCERLLMRREGCFQQFVSFITENGEKRYDNTYIYALHKHEWRPNLPSLDG